MEKPFAPATAGMGLRRSMLNDVVMRQELPVDFLEVAPENWMGVGGRLGKQFRALTERHEFMCHGLSLSIGSPAPLDEAFVRQVGQFLRAHDIRGYSEHLSYCSDESHLYDLLPIPFTMAAARYVAERIQRIQDILGQRLIIENVSTYLEPGKEMEEAGFVNEVLTLADCDLLLDVNNVYVNAVNHGGRDGALERSRQYIDVMPTERIQYLHVAGHFEEADDLLIDTHGKPVNEDVWQLLGHTYQRHGVKPTLLERDFNLPPLDALLDELQHIRDIQASVAPAVVAGAYVVGAYVVGVDVVGADVVGASAEGESQQTENPGVAHGQG